MIKVSGTKGRTIRETTASYEYTDEKGHLQSEDIRVRYFSLSWNEIEAEHSELKALSQKDPTAPVWPHIRAAKRIESLPDLADEHGKPFPITPESLGALDARNLAAIKKAIDDDLVPKEQPST